MSREQFDAAIGAVPPSTVDVDAVLARERGRARVRRFVNPWTTAGAGVAAVAAGAALVLVPGGSGGSGGTAVVPGAAGTPSAPPSDDPCAISPYPPQTGPPIPETADVAANRLSGVLTAAVRQRVAAGTKLQPHAQGEYPKGKQHGPLTFYHVFSARVPREGACSGGEDYFMAAATTVDGARKGNVWAIVTRLGGNATPATECADPPEGAQGSCDRTTGPHGETVVALTFTYPGQATVNQVNVGKPDGTGIIVEAENIAGSAKQPLPPDMPSPPLSLDQLREVALDPGLTLYP
ncbi:hypothetical protein QRX60_02475 [Amycolatopsis mongoliensis]|uniref:Uncharacterized protein n=1 Tax=Amycolatopsis mongoliensis TaxID=715475 RepID=A0A9Y2NFB8_9PSEU|nr:hypothetical protein [Amycolatopsis sp. 4-36]WIY02762.1 hypothetical protein QRX60_02475 [Amycolatopsis sp. 4-36]